MHGLVHGWCMAWCKGGGGGDVVMMCGGVGKNAFVYYYLDWCGGT